LAYLKTIWNFLLLTLEKIAVEGWLVMQGGGMNTVLNAAAVIS